MKYKLLATSTFLITISMICGAIMDQRPELTTLLLDLCAGCAIVGLALFAMYLLEAANEESK